MPYQIYETDIGPLTIAQKDGSITHVRFGAVGFRGDERCETELIGRARSQIERYLAGELTQFDLPLAPCGSAFQTRVWRELEKIPYGETASYGQIAERVGNPKASRAVGGANNKNPIAIVIPCHRVIGANGSLVGYGGGLDIKGKLLALERNRVDGRV